MLGGGSWKVQDGALRQTAERQFVRALAGDKSWTDYTLTLKARKISGSEGFLILFHINGDEDRTWWNIGGWGNTQDAIEGDEGPDSKPCRIETDHWYDIKLTVAGTRLQCWLDGALIHDVGSSAHSQYNSLYATSALDARTGDVIVKVVNVAAEPLETQLDLSSAKLLGKGAVTVLTSGSPTDENSLNNPTKVSPKTEAVSFNGTTITRSFPGNSLTVLRLQADK
jgi:alpha-L-arabinofuranosidase